MFHLRVLSFIIPALLCFTSCTTHAQQNEIRITDQIPLDAGVLRGTLDNGLTYYIRANKKPEKRMELRLAVNAGSVLEDDDQQGLAHFVEHMCFNGTEHFPKQDLVNFLEAIGVRFGSHLNAYTSFEETVYMLQAPTDREDLFSKAFQVLGDWAGGVSLEAGEIDKERGVIGEEWRLGRGAGERIANKQYPTIFYHSRFAERLPIGKKEIIDGASHEAVRRFYRDWYRPDLMAVIAVGDFDPAKVLEQIQSRFGGLRNPAAPRARTRFPMPDHTETLVTIASDPELQQSAVSIYFKRPERIVRTVGHYRYSLLSRLYDAMLNARFAERMQKPSCPFVFAGASDQRFLGNKQAFTLNATAKEIIPALEALLQEVNRIKQHGFTESELDREKKKMLRTMEATAAEREKTESARYIGEYVRHFLQGEPAPGVEFEYELYKKYLPGVSLSEVNALTKDRLTDGNRVVALSAPAREGISLPSEAEVRELIDQANSKSVEAYRDEIASKPLLHQIPAGGSVVSEKTNDRLGTIEWKLSNGISVTAKKTDFKNDEVLFTAFSPGGSSLAPDDNYLAASAASMLASVSGVGEFDQIALQKFLAGKLVRVNPTISETHEGFQGSSSPKDLETLFQLIYAYSTAPRKDTSAFSASISRIKSMIRNKSNSPEAALQDTVVVTMAQYHPRVRPMSPSLLDEMDPGKGYEFYRERFADLGDFTFVFVGNFSIDTLKLLTRKYLAALPTTGRNESWRDVGVRPPSGLVSKQIFKGVESKSSVTMIRSGGFAWNTQNRFELQALMEILQIKLREVLREEKGGVYGVMAAGSPTHYPIPLYRITIGFGCSPDRVDELLAEVEKQMDSLRTVPVADSYIQKIKELQKRELETSIKENRFWLTNLSLYAMHGDDPEDILTRSKRIESINAVMITEAAIKYLSSENIVKVALYPEKK